MLRGKMASVSRVGRIARCCGGAAGPTAPAGASFAAVAHPSCCRSDAANTVACGDGDAIRWWRDLVTGTWHEQATSGSRLILRSAGGKWYAEASAGSGTMHVFGETGVTYPLEIAAGYRSATGNAVVFGASGGSGQNAIFYRTGLNDIGGLVQNGGNRYYTSNTADGALDWKATLSLSGSVSSFSGSDYLDGSLVSGPTPSTGAASPATYRWVIGGLFGGAGSYLSGRVYGVCAFESVRTSGQRAEYLAWLAEYMP